MLCSFYLSLLFDYVVSNLVDITKAYTEINKSRLTPSAKKDIV